MHTSLNDVTRKQTSTRLKRSLVWPMWFISFPCSRPAGKAAAARCPSWWWVTNGTSSGSASCRAAPSRFWWRRPGSVATWSARPSSTGTWSCSLRNCWASPWPGACAKTTLPYVCRGRYRGTAALLCDPQRRPRKPLWPQAPVEKRLKISMAGKIPRGLLLYWADFTKWGL